MPEYDSNAEQDGQYLVAFVESAGEVSPVFERKVRRIFETHVGGLDAESWYDTDDCVEAYREVLDEIGDKTMEQAGIQVGKSVPWPEEVETVHDGLSTVNTMHKAAFRNSPEEFPAGRYVFEDICDRRARVGITAGYPYTAPFAKGVFTGIAQDLGRDVAGVTVEEADRKHGEKAAWIMEW
jgi:hypothetical protein